MIATKTVKCVAFLACGLLALAWLAGGDIPLPPSTQVAAAALDNPKDPPKAVQKAAEILELARAKPDDATGCDAAIWLIKNIRGEKEVKEALEILRVHHLTSPKMANVVTLLAYAE